MDRRNYCVAVASIAALCAGCVDEGGDDGEPVDANPEEQPGQNDADDVDPVGDEAVPEANETTPEQDENPGDVENGSANDSVGNRTRRIDVPIG